MPPPIAPGLASSLSPLSLIAVFPVVYYVVPWLAATLSWSYLLLLGVLGMILACCITANLKLDPREKLQIEYRVMSANEVLQATNIETDVWKYTVALQVLSEKYSQSQENGEIALLCLRAVYARTPTADVVDAQLALLALLAKQDVVRQRHLFEADLYGIDIWIKAIQQDLEAARTSESRDDDRRHAEVQRKACLWMGALSDGAPELARLATDEGGTESILQALSFYRQHRHVCSWGLWALFCICFEYPPAKLVLVQLHGLPIILTAMQHCGHDEQVARHGTALVFDLLRQSDDDGNGHKSALLGTLTSLQDQLHKALLQAMEHHSAMDVMMMGQELLAATGYQGPVPGFQGPLVPSVAS